MVVEFNYLLLVVHIRETQTKHFEFPLTLVPSGDPVESIASVTLPARQKMFVGVPPACLFLGAGLTKVTYDADGSISAHCTSL